MNRSSKPRAFVLLLLCALFALVALTPAHGNGPTFCLCDWHELLGEESGAPGSNECAHCDEEVPLRPSDGPLTYVATFEALSAGAQTSLRVLAHGTPAEVLCWTSGWAARGGTPARPPQNLSLRI